MPTKTKKANRKRGDRIARMARRMTVETGKWVFINDLQAWMDYLHDDRRLDMSESETQNAQRVERLVRKILGPSYVMFSQMGMLVEALEVFYDEPKRTTGKSRAKAIRFIIENPTAAFDVFYIIEDSAR